MDNQQDKTDFMKTWLTGFIDGEGYLSVLPQRRKGYEKTYWVPVIKLASTSKLTIDRISLYYKLEEIPHRVEHRTGTKNSNDSWSINIEGWKRVSKFFVVFNPVNFITKQHEAKCLAALVEARLGHSYKDPYSNQELNLVESLRNKRVKRISPQRLHADSMV